MATTDEFPQADRLGHVGLVAVAVSKGRHSDSDIIKDIPGLGSDRQGRYYRQAAELLGLIVNQNNHSSLTPLGAAFVGLTPLQRMDFLSQRLVDTEVFRAGLDFIRVSKPTDAQLRAWFLDYFPGAESTGKRRWSTYISFLKESGLIETLGGRLTLVKYFGNVAKKKTAPPPSKTLTGKGKPPGAPPSPGNGGVVSYDVDLQKLERANKTHWSLVDGKSRFLETRGVEPLQTVHIDLYGELGNDLVMYEMKSVSDAAANLLTQIRKAIAQLFEYRYLYSEPHARLCIVTNEAVPTSVGTAWILKYLTGPLQISYEWTADFKKFDADDSSKVLLGPFAP